MRIIVTGGRDYQDREAVFLALDEIDRETPIGAVISGGATGADRWADEWAITRSSENRVIKSVRFPANWADINVPGAVIKYRRDGQPYNAIAGFARNQTMVDTKPDLVVAFPGGRGTADCTRRAQKGGIPVRFITANKTA